MIATKPSRTSRRLRRGRLTISPLLRRAACALALILGAATGQRAMAATGGPDAYGYTFSDTTSGGVAYNFENISATGTVAATVSNALDAKETIPIGFTFKYYGTSYTSCDVATHGYIGFNNFGGTNAVQFNNAPLPSAVPPNEIIAGWWDDLNPGGAGTIYYQTLGTAPDRRFIIQYDGIQQNAAAGLVTFEFKLFESSNTIEVHYASVPSNGSSSIGLENAAGTVGLQYFSGSGLPPIGAGPFAIIYSPFSVRNANGNGAGSLRQAITGAAPGSTIRFSPALSGQTIALGGTELTIGKNLGIDASDLSGGITVSGGNSSRVFQITAGNTVTLDSLTVSGGNSTGGGGILNSGGILNLTKSTISGNSAPGNFGGGILNVSGGTLNATNCTIANNSANFGGGIFSDSTGTLSHMTIANNTAASGGGGIWLNAGSLGLHNSIVSENTSPGNQNAVNAGSSTLPQTGVNIIGGLPQLAPLANYGGPTLTRPPMPGSPAVNTATGASPAVDQRGSPRPVGAAADIGAVESNFALVASANTDSGPGSLRAHLAVAIPGSTITFAPAFGGQTITLTSGELLISRSLTIDATGLAAGLKISGNNASRVVNVAPLTTVSLAGLTITRGGGPVGGGGGGILNQGTLSLTRCTISGNHAADQYGGGIHSPTGTTLTTNHCTVADNRALYGAGIYSSGTTTLTHTTISANASAATAGGLEVDGGDTTINHCIISGNTGSNIPDVEFFAGTLTPAGVNLIGDPTSTGLTASPTLLLGDARLAPLANYGGSTATMPPLALSAAINPAAAASTSAFTTDQRGYPRVVGGKVDIGAVEAGPVITVANTNDTGAGSLRQAIAESGTPGTRILFAAGLSGQTIQLTSAELSIAAGRSLSIDTSGLAAGITINGGNARRGFFVQGAATVGIHGLTIINCNGIGGFGGGVANEGTLSLSNSSVSNNSSTGGGAGIWSTGTLVLTNCTIAANSGNFGSGLWAQAGTASLIHTTICGNTASNGSGGLVIQNLATSIRNSIIAANVGVADPDIGGGGSALSFDGNNLIGQNTGPYSAAMPAGLPNTNGDFVGTSATPVDPRLGALANYGGASRTLPLLLGSPAIDAVQADYAPPVTDQRGRARVADGDGNGFASADIGAFEVGVSQVTTAANSGTGSLRSFVEGPGTGHEWITFDPTVFNGSHDATITLASQLTLTNTKVLHLDASALPYGVTLSGNGVTRAIEVQSGSTVEIKRMTVTRGFADGRGGGIYNLGTLSVRDSTFSYNYATVYGGGIDNNGTLSLTNCTVASNAAASDAGGVDNYQGVSLTIVNSTISGNASGGAGGGIWSNEPLTLSNCLIAGNRAIAHNDLSGTVTSNPGGNLIGDGTGTGGVTHGVNGDKVGTGSLPIDPRLAPLAYYGGPTETMALLAGSPAINAGLSSGSVPPVDQRGFPRVGQADTGALEAGPLLLVTNTNDAGAGSLRQAVAGATAPGARILFNLTTANSLINLTTAELAVPDGRTIFIDASSLTNGAGNPTTEPDPLHPGATFVPRGVTVSGGGGMRVFSLAGSSTVAMHHLKITAGYTESNGGGIFNGGKLTLVDSTISGCSSISRSGGLFNGGTAALIRCTVSGNHADELGGGMETTGLLSLTNSTVSGNTAFLGAGIYSFNTVSLANSTVSANTASYGGGAVTQSGKLHLTNSVIAGNAASTFPDIGIFASNEISSGGGNFIGENGAVTAQFPAGAPNLTDDFVGTSGAPLDPLLGPLARHGGPTFTMAPLPGSPLINGADGFGTPPFTDQRGFARILAGALDIGAHESGASDYNPAGLTLFAKVPVAVGDAGTLRFEISTDADFFPTADTIAGNGTQGTANGAALESQFLFPSDVAQDSFGNFFIADSGNNRIRMLTPDGEVSTIAGTGDFGHTDGSGPLAKFSFPAGVAVGPDDNLYVSDTINHCIRKLVRPELPGLPWTVSTLAGTGIAGFTEGLGTVARFNHPHALSVDAGGNLFVADTSNHRIRKVSPEGLVSTYAGTGASGNTNGNRLVAKFSSPFGVAVDSAGNLFVADTGNHRIRRIGSDGQVTTVAGSSGGFLNGFGTAARFSTPTGVAVDALGSLVVADQANHAIRKVAKPINPADPWETTTLGGTGVAGFKDDRTTNTGAKFNFPTGLCVAANGQIIIADQFNHRIRRISNPLSIDASALGQDPYGNNFSAVINGAALGLRPETTYYFRWVAADGSSQPLGESFTLVPIPTVKTTAATAVTRTSATINGKVDPNGYATTVSFDYSTDPELLGPMTVATLSVGLSGPKGLAVDSDGTIFVAASSTNKILMITPEGAVSDFAGSGVAGFADGPGATAQFDHPVDLAIDLAGNLYVTDELNHRIRRITPGGVVSTIAGSGVAGFSNHASANAGKLLFPCGIAVTPNGSHVYVADRGNQRIRVINGGSLGTLAGTGIAGFTDGPAAAAQFNQPTGVAVDAFGNVFVADRDNHRIRLINAGEEVLTYAGSGTQGFLDGDTASAQFAFPSDVAINEDGQLYVTDRGNHRLRTISNTGEVATLAGSGIEGVLDSPLSGELWPATATRFSSPVCLALDAGSGAVYLTEEGSTCVRRVSRAALLSITLPGTYSSNGDLNLGIPIPEALVPGASYYFRIRAANSQGPAVGKILSFTTPTEPEIAVFEGVGVETARMSNVQPLAVDFGVTPLGTPVTRQFTITNDGGWNLTISAIDLPEGYRVARRFADPGVPFSIDTFGSDYDTELGLFNAAGHLLASNDDVSGNQSQIDLPVGLAEGTYHLALSGFNTAFGDGFVAAGGVAGGHYLLHYPGGVQQGTQASGTVRWFTFQIGAGGGAIVPGTPATIPISAVIPPGGSLTFAAILEAVSGGTFDGNVEIVSDDPEQGSFNFPVTGVVMEAPAVVTVAASDLGSGTATFNGIVNPMGSSTTAWFEYSPDPEFDGVRVSTIAGAGSGYAEGSGIAALFNQPSALASGVDGAIYVADTLNHRIRRIDPDGSSSTIAGTGVPGFADGPAASAQFNQPAGLVIGADGTLFVSDSLNHRIRAISPGGEVSTYTGLGVPGYTDGVASAARFNGPKGLAIDIAGNLYVADTVQQFIRKVATDGSVSTLAPCLAQPAGIASTGDGTVYYCEGNRISRITPGGGATIFAGNFNASAHLDDLGTAARFSSPAGLALDASGNLYVADRGNHRIRKATPDGLVTTVAGSGSQGSDDGLGEVARFNNPFSVTVSASGEVIAGEAGQSTIRRITPTRILVQVATGLTGADGIPVSHLAEGLEPGATYYFRAIATNFVGTTYGNTLSSGGSPFQAWQAAEFGPDADNPLIAGELANPTGDGLPNILKYALLMDPNLPSHTGLPLPGLTEGTLTLTYTKVLAATDLNYVVEWSTDLFTWSTVGVTEQDLGGNTVTRQIRASVPVAGLKMKYVRLNVTLQP